jgi:hypothetical protein
MGLILGALLALLLLTLVAYVQLQLARFTKPGARILLTRLFLFLVAAAFGWTAAANVEGALEQSIAFLIGFGIVHIPAAVILFIKSKRGEGKS